MAGWIGREQDAVIEYLREENRVLKQQLGRRRLRLTDAQRRTLAIRGKAIGRRALAEVASLVTPDTILRWHRQLIAQKRNHQGLENRLIEPVDRARSTISAIECVQRLGGVLSGRDPAVLPACAP